MRKASAKFKDNPDFVPQVRYIRLPLIEPNDGQLSKYDPDSGEQVGLPKNPRWIRDVRYEALKKSITDDPEYLNYNPLKVFPLDGIGLPGRFMVVDGNHRRQACSDLGFEEVPCMVFLPDTPMEKLRAYAIKGNLEFAQNDWDALANEWDSRELESFGLEIVEFTPPKREKVRMRMTLMMEWQAVTGRIWRKNTNMVASLPMQCIRTFSFPLTTTWRYPSLT